MLMKLKVLASAAVALALAGGGAHATSYWFGFSGHGVSGSGQLTTSGGGSTQTVTGATGEISDTDGLTGGPFTITGLSPYADSDNLLSTTSPIVDFGGISVATTGGHDFNLFNNGSSSSPAYELLVSDFDPGGAPTTPPGGFPISFSISAVPEPASWLMLIMGVASLGAGLRLARKSDELSEAEA
jgi:hypothetical protein